MEDRGGIGFIDGGQLVEHFGSLEVAQAAVADAQLDTGQIAVAIRGDKAAPAVVTGASEGQSVPIGGLPVLLPLEKPEADVAADLGPGPVIGELAQQAPPAPPGCGPALCGKLGAVAACSNVFSTHPRPSPGTPQSPQSLLPAVMVSRAPGHSLELLRASSLSRLQLALIDTQISVRSEGWSFVGNGKISVQTVRSGGPPRGTLRPSSYRPGF